MDDIIELIENGVDVCKDLKKVFKMGRAVRNAFKKNSLPINPYMGPQGAAIFEVDAPSPRTKKNLRWRKMKAHGSKAFSALGAAGAAAGSVVNTADIAKHAVAGTTTAVHLYHFRQMAKRVRDGGSLRRQLDLLVELKAAKLGARAVNLVVSSVPGVGALDMVGKGVGFAHEKLYLRVRKERIAATALSLHWLAYREIKLLGPRAAMDASVTGPALGIVRELMGLGIDVGMPIKLHSLGEIVAVMQEPAGYKVIQYKLEQT
jgi:hypothetical protein